MDPEEYFLTPDSGRTETFFQSSRQSYRAGHQGRTLTQVSADGRSIQYWLFMPKNGCQGAQFQFRLTGPIKIGNFSQTQRTLELCNLAIHEGDWENVTITLNADRTAVDTVYLSAHGDGNWMPASAVDFRGAHPYVYAALNSHALYARDVGFAANATITHPLLDKVLGIEWFQIGDILSTETYTLQDPLDGRRAFDFDVSQAIAFLDDFDSAAMKSFDAPWGKTVDAKTILDLPEIADGPIESILKTALNIAVKYAPELQDKSNGDAPTTPWTRGNWSSFDDAANPNRFGLVLDTSAGGTGGGAFDDYEAIKAARTDKVTDIALDASDRVHQVCVSFAGAATICHGKASQGLVHLTLDPGEYIVDQEAAIGSKDGSDRIFALRITTNRGRSLEGGTWTSQTASWSAPKGMQLVGWRGASGDEVDKLGPIYGTLGL